MDSIKTVPAMRMTVRSTLISRSRSRAAGGKY